MDKLVAFVKACLDEDARVARGAEHPDGPQTLEWRTGGARHLTFSNRRSEDYRSVFCGDWDRILVARDGVIGDVAGHIARHDPRSVLARVESGRAIVERWQEVTTWTYSAARKELLNVLCWLAWGYRHREGYDPSWAPEGVEVPT